MNDNLIINNNPLNSIFIEESQGKYSSEISSLKNINLFFEYIVNETIDNDKKSNILDEFTQKLKINRYISEYFSSYENRSIYLLLIDLYLSQKEIDSKLKSSIINLLNELRINIQTGKEIYEYIFQKLSLLYRGEVEIIPDNLYNYLRLLYIILGDILAITLYIIIPLF